MEMQQVNLGGSLFRGIMSAARAWACNALPDTRVIGDDEDPAVAADALEAYWWGEAQKIGEGAPEGVDDDEWRAACRSALVERIEETVAQRPKRCLAAIDEARAAVGGPNEAAAIRRLAKLIPHSVTGRLGVRVRVCHGGIFRETVVRVFRRGSETMQVACYPRRGGTGVLGVPPEYAAHPVLADAWLWANGWELT